MTVYFKSKKKKLKEKKKDFALCRPFKGSRSWIKCEWTFNMIGWEIHSILSWTHQWPKWDPAVITFYYCICPDAMLNEMRMLTIIIRSQFYRDLFKVLDYLSATKITFLLSKTHSIFVTRYIYFRLFCITISFYKNMVYLGWISFVWQKDENECVQGTKWSRKCFSSVQSRP